MRYSVLIISLNLLCSVEISNKLIVQTVITYRHADVSSIDTLPSSEGLGRNEVNCLSSDEFKIVCFCAQSIPNVSI